MAGLHDFLSAAARLDADVFSFINRACANAVGDLLMPAISLIGDTQGIFILSLLILLLAKNGKRRSVVVLWAGLSVSYYVVAFLKEVIGRPRPFLTIVSTHLLMPASNFSFPSGHTTVSFMAATIVSHYFGWRAAFFGFAVLVGISRIAVGVHYPSDVLAGALLGTLIGIFLLRLAKTD